MFCTKCDILRRTNTNALSKWVLWNKWYSTSAELASKGIEDLPAARGLPFIGTTLSLIMAGSYPKLVQYMDKRHKLLGPVFKESIGPVPCVFVSDPEAMRLVFANEGKYPVHLLPEAWTTYNTLHNVSRGLFFMNGEEWLHFRRILNPLLLKGDLTWLDDSCAPAVNNLLETFKKFSESNENVIIKMEELLYRWSLEVIVSVLIGSSNYARAKTELDSQIAQLASTIHLVFDTSSKLALIPSSLAAKFKIARWKNFETSVTLALKSSTDLVEVLSQNYTQTDDGLLGKLKGQMTANELAKIVTDLVLAAGDTTAYSMEWLLYLVGKHPEVQRKLREEVRVCYKKGQKITSNLYLKNVVKESLRLYPVAPFLTRILPETITIRGYNIPAGTVLVLSIFTTGREERNFKNPSAFDPDRWSRNEIRSGIAQSAALPFAIGAREETSDKLYADLKKRNLDGEQNLAIFKTLQGPCNLELYLSKMGRSSFSSDQGGDGGVLIAVPKNHQLHSNALKQRKSCIGKKLAETQLQLTLGNVVHKFDFSILNNKDVDIILKMVAVPSEEIRFKFKALK